MKRVLIDWVFKLKANPKNRYALEFVKDWDVARIVAIRSAILVSIVFASCLSAGPGGDLHIVFTIAGFALAASTSKLQRMLLKAYQHLLIMHRAFVALLAIYSQTDR
jgi:hypothetical protein